jgi:hypothetical protein
MDESTWECGGDFPVTSKQAEIMVMAVGGDDRLAGRLVEMAAGRCAHLVGHHPHAPSRNPVVTAGLQEVAALPTAERYA